MPMPRRYTLLSTLGGNGNSLHQDGIDSTLTILMSDFLPNMRTNGAYVYRHSREETIEADRMQVWFGKKSVRVVGRRYRRAGPSQCDG